MLDSSLDTQPNATVTNPTGAPPHSAQPLDADLDILGDDDDNQAQLPAPQRRPWYTRPAPLISLGVIVVLILIIATPFALRAIRGPRVRHQTQTLAQGTLTLAVGASGNVLAPVYDATFQHQGTIASINVSVGQQVNSGDTLATLNYTLSNGTTGTETITAPHSGTVVAINGVVGGAPSSAAAAPFIQIDDLTATYLQLNVNESDIASVAKGQVVQFTVSAYPNLNPFIGTVSLITPAGQNTSNVVSYPVTVAITTSSLQGANLLPEMSANATIILTQRTHALLIPASAISYAHSEASSGAVSSSAVSTALAQANQMVSAIKKAGGTPASDNPTANYALELTTGGGFRGMRSQLTVVPVVLGLTDGTNYEVLGGLNAGDAVVIS